MDKLVSADIQTRKLTPFELNAFEKVESQQDIVISRTKDGIQMVGSVRAGKSCIQCHSVAYGELLGAFSYRFHRAFVSDDNE